jgi:hypothetical protein
MEYLDLRVTSIDDVIADVAHRGSGCAWHTAIYLGPCSLAREKKNGPFYQPSAKEGVLWTNKYAK